MSISRILRIKIRISCTCLATAVVLLTLTIYLNALPFIPRHRLNFHAPFPPLIDATTEDLHAAIVSGRIKSVDLVHAYITRILEVNETLSAVTQLNPDAITIAQALDDERKAGKIRSPLHGIPILIKNNIGTQDKMANTAGSYALNGARLPRDSTVAMKLREAGAVILGKTGLSQWANFRSLNTSNGWSAIGGQVKGAYVQDQDPAGSSSGSGVSASVALALAALGTETDGSLISPASSNNIVAIKPSVGLVARDLVIPVSEHQDTVGPMARSVKDAAYVLSVIAGPSRYDNYTDAIPFDTTPDYVSACKTGALKGKRIGVPRNLFNMSANSALAAQIPVFEAALKLLETGGATIVENTNFTGAALQGNSSSVVLDADFISGIAEYFAGLSFNPNKIHSLEDLKNYITTKVAHKEDYPERDVAIWDRSLSSGFNNSAPEFWTYYQENLRLAGPLGITGALQNYSLDALVLPTVFASRFPALLGSPVVSVPLGFYPQGTRSKKNNFGNLIAIAPGIPFGISFLGPRFSEELLIGLAYDYEQRSLVRNLHKPLIQPRNEVRRQNG